MPEHSMNHAEMRRRLNRAILICFVLCGSQCFWVTGGGQGHAEEEKPESAITRDLSVRASRVIYEAQEAIKREDHDKAVRMLEKFVEKHPDQDHCLVEFTLGNALYFSGRKEACLAPYQAAVRMDPACGPAWVNLGQAAYELERYGLAARALVKGFVRAEEEDKSPDLLYYAAVAHILDGCEEEAEPILEDLVSGKHGEPEKEWFQALLNVYLNLERQNQAEKLIGQLMQQYGDDPETWRLSYQFEANRKNYKLAAVALTIYGYLKPLSREEGILLADLYAAIKVPVLACSHYEDAFASGASPEEYERLASAYIAAHRPREARQTLARALERQPNQNLWSLLGDLNYVEEDFEGAYYAFEESARLDPKDGRAYLMMGYCALHLNKTKEAVAALHKAQGFPKQRQLAGEILEHVEPAR